MVNLLTGWCKTFMLVLVQFERFKVLLVPKFKKNIHSKIHDIAEKLHCTKKAYSSMSKIYKLIEN